MTVGVKFEKVKNEYRFIREDGKYWYLDVNDGKWYGLRGGEIKKKPSFFVTDYPNRTSATFVDALDTLFNMYSYSPEYLKYLDAIFSIVLNENKEDKPITSFSVYELPIYYKNIKILSQYLHSIQNEEEIDMWHSKITKFSFEKKYERYMNFINREIQNYNIVHTVNNCARDLNMSVDIFMEKYGMNLIHYYNKGILDLISVYNLTQYYSMCEDLDMPPKKGDFIKNYYEIKKIRNEKENEIKKKKIRENQTRKDFSFEDEDFYVSVPTTLEEFTKLGEEFHNCIGSWELDNHILPQTHVLVILRAKDESWKIACDFRNLDFRIDQFYKPCNEHVKREDVELMRAREIYQSYLYTLKDE